MLFLFRRVGVAIVEAAGMGLMDVMVVQEDIVIKGETLAVGVTKIYRPVINMSVLMFRQINAVLSTQTCL